MGPFALEPLNALDCASFRSEDASVPSGGHYVFGVTGVAAELRGRLSKAAAVNPNVGWAPMRPRAAKKFAFAYPSDPRPSAAEESTLSPAVASFLRLGGYVYWDAGGEVCGLRALVRGLTIHFSHPHPLTSHPGVRKAIYAQGRACKPIFAQLRDCGVTGFAWIAPGEVLGVTEEGKMLWKNGAFVCLYEEEDREFDCFYSITEVMMPRNRHQASILQLGSTAAAGLLPAAAPGVARMSSLTSSYSLAPSTPGGTQAADEGAADHEGGVTTDDVRLVIAQELAVFAAKAEAKLDATLKAAPTAPASSLDESSPSPWQLLAAAALGAVIAVAAQSIRR